jgi:hypothetical protein
MKHFKTCNSEVIYCINDVTVSDAGIIATRDDSALHYVNAFNVVPITVKNEQWSLYTVC